MKPIKLARRHFLRRPAAGSRLAGSFLQAVAHALQQDCSSEIGPGTVARVCREMQRQFFDSPDFDRAVPRWARKGGGIRAAAET